MSSKLFSVFLFFAIFLVGCATLPQTQNKIVPVAKICDSGGWNCQTITVERSATSAVTVENEQSGVKDFQVPCRYPGRLVKNSKSKWVCEYPGGRQPYLYQGGWSIWNSYGFSGAGVYPYSYTIPLYGGYGYPRGGYYR